MGDWLHLTSTSPVWWVWCTSRTLGVDVSATPTLSSVGNPVASLGDSDTSVTIRNAIVVASEVAQVACLSLGADFLALITCSLCCYPVITAMETALLLPLLLLVKVNCQTFPYVSFMGQTLADHSYVNLSTVGSAGDNSDSVVCHTDLSTCCSGGQGIHRGNWSFPDGTLLPSIGNSVPIGLGRAAQRAIIRRTTATGPTAVIFQRLLSIMLLTSLWEKQSMWDCI